MPLKLGVFEKTRPISNVNNAGEIREKYNLLSGSENQKLNVTNACHLASDRILEGDRTMPLKSGVFEKTRPISNVNNAGEIREKYNLLSELDFQDRELLNRRLSVSYVSPLIERGIRLHGVEKVLHKGKFVWMLVQERRPNEGHQPGLLGAGQQPEGLALLPWIRKDMGGFQYNPLINYHVESDIGRMERVCVFCNALKWKGETVGMCCSSGKVRLPLIQSPPEPLNSLLTGDRPESRHFFKKVHSYNSAFQMTSFGANVISEGNFMPTFKVQGQVYHLIGFLLPSENEIQPKFLQLYFIADYLSQAEQRAGNFTNMNIALLRELQEMLHNSNSYVQSFKSAVDTLPAGAIPDLQLVIQADRRPRGEHRGRYNEPTTNEVAVLLVNQECSCRDIIISGRGGELRRISETHRSYDALQYPLMFPRGEDGYNFLIFQVDPTTGEENDRKKTSALQFYAYRMMIRQNEFNPLIYYRQLTNQFWVDMYAKIETERLTYLRTNQTRLRMESYIHLRDALGTDEDPQNMGQLVILPSTFTGGPRYMHQRTQDAFCYVRKYGRPDLFITFTTNPRWGEIVRELLPGQGPQDRHDVVSRVFNLKLKVLINLLTKNQLFGAASCYMYSVEWQKRGLPHAHILLWLREKIRPAQIDDVIRAEFPDPAQDPELYSVVKNHMVHGPCGFLNLLSPCMREGRCSKKYPRAFVRETITGDDGYPTYKRRSPAQGGFTATLRYGGRDIIVDNSWVVPYSPVLSRTLKAHINVEFCSSVQSIKYICKYVNKGSDQATFGVRNNRDEITTYQSGRYISTSEAVWRILSFHIHERFPPVIRLDIHLESGQRVYFQPENLQERLENPKNTTLLAFFKVCTKDAFASTLLYEEVPSYYTFNRQRGEFCRRKQGTPVEGHPGVKKEHVIGRVFTIHPNNTECFHLRMLLYNIRGPTSFASLKTINGVVQPTYQAACRSLGLLEDDEQWHQTLTEAAVSDSPRKLRELFAIILIFCSPSDPLELWHQFKRSLCEDVFRDWRRRSIDTSSHDVEEHCYDRGLALLEEAVQSNGGQPLSHYSMPSPQNLILAKVRSSGKIALAVASSGIAATLLPGGRTAHSTFKIPIGLDRSETPICNISRNSDLAKVIQDCHLIVWDECTMANKKAIEAVDRTIRDIRSTNTVMGSITTLFSGDFRQILPVVYRGTRADEVNACLEQSTIWPAIEKVTLTTNMSVQLGGSEESASFSSLLLRIGDGTIGSDDNVTLSPQLCNVVSTIEDLISRVYPDAANISNQSEQWLCNRAILTLTNDQANSINSAVLDMFEAEEMHYRSLNSTVTADESVQYPTEFLESIAVPGLPAHILKVKIGVPVMLMRNLNPPKLCNGTRLLIKALHRHVIHAMILTGSGKGEMVFIPRIPIIPTNFPFQFKRIQFPISVCFAMTINKAQGQMLQIAGIDVRSDCFSHGQFYVACSRVTSPSHLFICTSNRTVKNVVYQEALQKLGFEPDVYEKSAYEKVHSFKSFDDFFHWTTTTLTAYFKLSTRGGES
ncbi:uncharacterized protein LOC143214169 [Lasioglossum baleicum]|uniref:uncharacterized protein LOC143214169 n=1 Tax=Lasioglossum baleicum TaxID=434251 RepID=UPI003FCDCF5E